MRSRQVRPFICKLQYSIWIISLGLQVTVNALLSGNPNKPVYPSDLLPLRLYVWGHLDWYQSQWLSHVKGSTLCSSIASFRTTSKPTWRGRLIRYRNSINIKTRRRNLINLDVKGITSGIYTVHKYKPLILQYLLWIVAECEQFIDYLRK